MVKRHILVAGMDCNFSGVNFSVFCRNRIKRIIKANKERSELSFITIDIAMGKITKLKVTYPKGIEKLSENELYPSKFKPITKDNYDGYKFKNGQKGIISILDIYQEIQNIGANNPGTLMEFSIFSHAYAGGPVLVNSYDDGEFVLKTPITNQLISFFRFDTVFLDEDTRDPDDFDPRSNKDFTAPTMTSKDLKNLQNAYHPDGFSWIWGCNMHHAIHKLLAKVENHKKYKSSGLKDTDKFRLRNLDEDTTTDIEMGLNFILKNPKDFTLEFGEIKSYICQNMMNTYSQILANNTKKPVMGAVLGTYSVYDKGALNLMSVFPDFKARFKFYENYFDFEFDKEGRNYGVYVPNKSC